MIRPRRTLTYLASLGLLLAPLPAVGRQVGSAPAPSVVEDMDQKAKRLFVAGKYTEAIDLLARLYTETSNPIYLRNIARCYQRLRDADRAIASFEEYLLRAKDVSKAERDEIRGFIRDLEDMKRRNAEAARPAPDSDVRPAAPVPPAPVPAPTSTSPSPPSPATGQPLAVTPGASPAPLSPGALPAPAAQAQPMPTTFTAAPPEGEISAAPARPIARTLALAGMAVGGGLLLGAGVMYAASWARYKSAEKDCPGKYWCAQDAAKVVESRSKLSKILLLSGVAVGLAGGAVFVLNPARPSELALGLGGRF